MSVLWLCLCSLALAAPAMARDLKGCVAPSTSFRRYHPVEGADGAQTSVYDEISVCPAESGLLSFSLSIAGEGGDRCYLEGKARPRQKGVFVFLRGEFRLRLQLTGDRVRIAEESGPTEARPYCGPSASIGSLEFKRHGE